MNPHRKRELRRSRDAVVIAKPFRLRSPVVFRPRVSVVSPVGDRRLYHPAMRLHRPVYASPRAAGRLVDRGPMRLATMLSFDVPKRVAICVRRKERREVLLALGRGGAGKRKPRRNMWSAIKC